jgi:pimeloyl-ACP methyl ester carboxylesterase
MPITDAQGHVWTVDTADRPWPPKGQRHESHLPEPLTADHSLNAPDATGFDPAAFVPSSWQGDHNDLVRHYVHRNAAIPVRRRPRMDHGPRDRRMAWIAGPHLTMRHRIVILLILAFCSWCSPVRAAEPWMQLPPTPVLPKGGHAATAAVNGIALWYETFGQGQPVILLHGGLANSSYWGNQVPVLAQHYHVIVVDSRGHGRSTRTDTPIAYDLMSSDVLALMDHLHIAKAAIVGWSDGAIIGLDIAIHHPERLTQLYAFAANSDPSGVKDVDQSPVFTAYEARAAQEYGRLSSTPAEFKRFLDNISHMWATEPHFTDDQLRGITVPTWIVDADHDEAIKRENTDHMAALIPSAGELILPHVSHFAFLQDPVLFNKTLLHFLNGR